MRVKHASVKTKTTAKAAMAIAAALLAIAAVPASAQAVQEWDCGLDPDNPGGYAVGTITCALADDGTFTVSGRGNMYKPSSGISIINGSVSSQGASPWHGRRKEIKRVVIGDGVTSIRSVAFFDCSNLESVTIAGSVTNIEFYAFGKCTSLTSVAIPDGVEIIGSGSFAECTGLTSVTIPSNVTEINWMTFEGCTGLTSMVIPDNVTMIGMDAFKGCTGLTSVSIGSGVTSIGTGAFEGCSGLTSVTVPAAVASIGLRTFFGCGGLASITVAAGNARYMSEDGVVFSKAKDTLVVYPAGKPGDYAVPEGTTIIRASAFRDSRVLTSITVPGSVTVIGEYAFAYCSSLVSITLPVSAASIGIGAFQNCIALTSVALPAGTASIANGMFSDCRSLASVTIPGSVTEIGNYAFASCSSLTSITIPPSVASIGGSAFQHCTALTSVVCQNPATPAIGTNAFPTSNEGICLYVPEESVAEYRAIIRWRDFQCVRAATGDMISVRRPPAVKASGGSLQVSVRGNALYVSMPEQQRTPGTPLQVRMIDVKGRTVLRENLYGNGRISLSHIPAGRYIIDIRRSGVRVWQSPTVARGSI